MEYKISFSPINNNNNIFYFSNKAIYMYNSRTMNQDYLDRYNILFQ